MRRSWIIVVILGLALGCGDCGDGPGPDETGGEQIGEWTPEVCDSGEDEDGDGRIDCADSDCYTHEVCVFEPVVNAPELPLNGVISLWERSSWLFESGLVQRGVEAGAIEPETIGTVRGQVLGTHGSPLVGAAVSVVGRPEFGRTYSRGDGLFDLAFAADDRLVLRVSSSGFVSSDRVLKTRHQMPTSLEQIVLVPLEAEATEVDFSKAQLVMGSESEDEDGKRRTAAIFPKGAKASLVFPNGARRELASMNVRLTEVTVGDDGRQAMMAELPPTTLYTYAAEFTVDEAVAENAERVEFSEPVFIYVDNFLGFEAGTIVPSGFYDRRQTVWEPMPNGVVLNVIDVAGGQATLSLGNGSLSAEDRERLGVTQDELRELSKLVKAGDSVWRVPTTHFSPFDFNWGGFYPPGTGPSPGPSDIFEQSCSMGQEAGSIIGCSNQTLGERIPLNGTPFELTYQSSRVSGRKPVVVVPVRPSLLDNVIAARVKVTAAGQRLDEREFLNVSEVPRIEEFIWNGKDGFGRLIQGAAEVEIEVDLVFPAPYNVCGWGIVSVPQAGVGVLCRPPTGIAEFPNPEFGTYPAEPGVQVSLGRSLVVITRKDTQTVHVGTYDVAREGLGGWTIGPQHRYDPIGRVLYYGNGQDLVAGPDDRVFEVISGQGADFNFERPEDGTDAKSASLGGLFGPAIGRDGTVYIHDTYTVRAIDPNTNKLSTVAGKFATDFIVDWDEERGGPALDARFNIVERTRIGKDGRLYIQSETAIWRLERDGTVNKLIGGDLFEFPDGTPSNEVNGSWQFMDASPDGTLYVASQNRVYRRTTDGRIRHVIAPQDSTCHVGISPCGDGGLAAMAELTSINAIAISGSGDLYIAESAENERSIIRKVRSDGVIESIPGNFPQIAHMEIGEGDIIHISINSFDPEHMGAGVLQVNEDGTLSPRVGVYESPVEVHEQLFGYLGRPAIDNESAKRPVASGYPFAIGPNSEIVFTLPFQIVRLRELFPGYTGANYQIPTPDGAAIDEFSPEGRHLASFDALTGVELVRFEYDPEGRLLKVHHRGENTTEVKRSGGMATQIVGPDGATWSMKSQGGMFSELTNPEGERWQFEYDDGLMTRMVNPRGDEWRFTYDEAGRLIEDRQPNSGVATLERDKDMNSVKFTSPAGRETTYFSTQPGTAYRDERVATGDFLSGVTQLRDGWVSSFSQDGTTGRTRTQSHPVYGMIASYPAEMWLETPSGLRVEASSELTATNNANDLKSGLESFTRTLKNTRGTATSSWDRATMTLSSESAERRRSSVVLDLEGRPERAEAPGIEPVLFEYDGRFRPIRATQGSRSVSMTYGADGYVESITGADGTVRLSRDAMGRITQGTRVDMSVIGVAYDVLGSPTSITPPGRPSYTMSSDFRGNLLTMVTPGGTQESYVLDLDHRLTSATKGDGRGWSVTYDTSDRVEQIVVAGEAHSFEYGEDAYITWARGGEADVEFEWDGPLPVRQASTGAVNGELTWTFEDKTLSLGSMSINGHVVDYSYDKDGLPLHIGAQSLAYQNGTYFLREREVGNASVTYAYSDFGELNDLRVRAGGELFRVRYTRDDLGRITEARETNQGITTTYAYTYDLLGQITEVRVNGTLHATYGYDANSNRVQVNSPNETVTSGQVVLNDDDQLTRYGNAFYQFNAAGQRTQKDVGTSVTRYTYGVLGELQRVELPDGRVVTYQYDALKRRIGRQVNGSTTERWLWGGSAGPVAEVDASGNTLTTYVYGTGINAPDYMVRGAEIYALIRDHVGSIRFVLNVADNAIAQELRYDTFGQVVLDTNPGFQPFGYAGGLYDPDTELTRFGARDYDAHTGRWTARDPIAFAGGQPNLYVYVGNDPINFVDPNGRAAVAATLIVAAALGAVGNWYTHKDQSAANQVRAAMVGAVGGLVGAGIILGGFALAGGAAAMTATTMGALLFTSGAAQGGITKYMNFQQCLDVPSQHGIVEDVVWMAFVTGSFATLGIVANGAAAIVVPITTSAIGTWADLMSFAFAEGM